MTDDNEIVPISERGHGRGVDKRRPVKEQRGTWKTRLDDDTLRRLQAAKDSLR